MRDLGLEIVASEKKQKKRTNDFINKTGTLIFASHSRELLERFCNRCLVFDKGNIVFDGPIAKAFNYYDEL